MCISRHRRQERNFSLPMHLIEEEERVSPVYKKKFSPSGKITLIAQLRVKFICNFKLFQ